MIRMAFPLGACIGISLTYPSTVNIITTIIVSIVFGWKIRDEE